MVHLDASIEDRKRISERYQNNLSNVSHVHFFDKKKSVKDNYAYFPILLNNSSIRDRVYEILSDNGIYSRKYFYPICTDLECYAKRYGNYKVGTARHIADRVLTLPIYEGLSDDDVDRVCHLLKNILENET